VKESSHNQTTSSSAASCRLQHNLNRRAHRNGPMEAPRPLRSLTPPQCARARTRRWASPAPASSRLHLRGTKLRHLNTRRRCNNTPRPCSSTPPRCNNTRRRCSSNINNPHHRSNSNNLNNKRPPTFPLATPCTRTPIQASLRPSPPTTSACNLAMRSGTTAKRHAILARCLLCLDWVDTDTRIRCPAAVLRPLANNNTSLTVLPACTTLTAPTSPRHANTLTDAAVAEISHRQ
jgi:hypothetical protein